jgi:hypothetical protein
VVVAMSDYFEALDVSHEGSKLVVTGKRRLRIVSSGTLRVAAIAFLLEGATGYISSFVIQQRAFKTCGSHHNLQIFNKLVNDGETTNKALHYKWGSRANSRRVLHSKKDEEDDIGEVYRQVMEEDAEWLQSVMDMQLFSPSTLPTPEEAEKKEKPSAVEAESLDKTSEVESISVDTTSDPMELESSEIENDLDLGAEEETPSNNPSTAKILSSSTGKQDVTSEPTPRQVDGSEVAGYINEAVNVVRNAATRRNSSRQIAYEAVKGEQQSIPANIQTEKVAPPIDSESQRQQASVEKPQITRKSQISSGFSTSPGADQTLEFDEYSTRIGGKESRGGTRFRKAESSDQREAEIASEMQYDTDQDKIAAENPDEEVMDDSVDTFMKSIQKRLVKLGYEEEEIVGLPAGKIDMILRNSIPSEGRGSNVEMLKEYGNEDQLQKREETTKSDLSGRGTPKASISEPVQSTPAERKRSDLRKGADSRSEPADMLRRKEPTSQYSDGRSDQARSPERRRRAPVGDSRRSSGDRSGRVYSERGPRERPPLPKNRKGGSPSKKRTEDETLVGNKWWPGLEPFREALKDETRVRAQILGPSFTEILKQEGKWRYGLYKDWLKLLKDGVGDMADVVPISGYEGRIEGRARPIVTKADRPKQAPPQRRRDASPTRRKELQRPSKLRADGSEEVFNERRRDQARMRYDDEMQRRQTQRPRVARKKETASEEEQNFS